MGERNVEKIAGGMQRFVEKGQQGSKFKLATVG